MAKPQELGLVKEFFDSTTMIQYEKSDPFKGSKQLNRTNNRPFYAGPKPTANVPPAPAPAPEALQ